MAFFKQLQLLLWKNGLAAIRQPLWSLTLIAWPLIIFIIIAVTRHQFPPILKQTCYVAPRNLPSAGFFPFLQTLMCNTDSTCHNTSRIVDPTESKSSENTRSGFRQQSSPLANLLQGRGFFNVSLNKDSSINHAQATSVLKKMFGSSFQDRINNVSLGIPNTTFPGDQETLNKMLESVNLVKKAMCTMTLPMVDTVSPSPLAYAAVTFCKSNDTLFEVSLLTLNQMLTEMVLTKPNETMRAAEAMLSVFDQLQNQTTLWESLLAVPQLFSSSSDQVLDSTKAVITNLQGAMNVIQNSFPGADASLSSVHPLLVGSVNTIHYVQNWPGKDVSIPLGEIVTLQNDSLNGMVKQVLQEVQIPLDKAVGLLLNKDIVHSYLCDNSSNSILLTAACTTGTTSMLLDWISPDMVAKQVVLAWSKDVAPHDVSFIKGMVNGITGGSSAGGQGSSNTARNRRSIDTQPQSIEEELFLSFGEVVLELLQIAPSLDTIVQRILRTGFQSMKSATLTLDTAAEMMADVLKDADQLQLTYLTLLTNQTEASIWIDRVLYSGMETVMKMLASDSLTCEDLLGPFEWLLNTESIKTEVWSSLICQNNFSLQQQLLVDWQPLGQEILEVYSILTGQTDFNVTLPMILAEWQKLVNSSLQFKELLERVTTELDGEYWMNWMPDNSTLNANESLLQSVSLFGVTLGENIETSEQWSEVKSYFHMAYWILNYRPGVTTQPANCSVNNNTLAIHCDTGFTWPLFVQAVNQALMSPSEALVNCIEGTLNLLQYAYGDLLNSNLTRNLDSFFQNVSILTQSNMSNPNSVLPLLFNLLKPKCLSSLLPLFLSDAPLNVSTITDIASKLGSLHQSNLTSNETDPTMLELEQLIMQFLSLEGNLTLPISHVMGYSLLNYFEYFNLDDVTDLREAIQPFMNKTSAGLIDAILSAIELLKTAIESPNGDPVTITFGYIRQLRELVMSVLRLHKIDNVTLPNGQLSPAQINMLSEDIINFLTHESLQNLTWVGPDAAQNIVMQKCVTFLPPGIQQEAALFLQNVRALEYQISEYTTGQNWSAAILEIFTFLNQTLDVMLSASGNVTIKIAANNSVLEGSECEEIALMFFSLFLSPNDDANVATFNQTLHFIRLIMATQNISVSGIQNALEQSNLTLEELHNLVALTQAVDIYGLLDNIMEIIIASQCLKPQQDSVVTAKCVIGLIDEISSFLIQLPNFHNETTILSLIPLAINRTISDIFQVNFSSNPNVALIQTLYSTLANVKMNLQLIQLNTPEIMNEIKVVEDLIQLIANMETFDVNTLMMDPMYVQKVYLEIVDWYLKRLENITSSSSLSELLHPFFYLTEMQLTLQLAQANFSSFVSNQVMLLIHSLQYPIDDAGVSKIGETAVEIFQRLFDLIHFGLEVESTATSSELFNTTILNATELHIKLYLDLIEKWMQQPNVSSALTSLLYWGNSSTNVSTHVTDIQQLLETLDTFLSHDQLAYLSVIDNITQTLTNALMLAEQSGGLQSEDFLDAVLEAVVNAMQIFTGDTNALPVSTQGNILKIVRDLLKLIVQPGMSFTSSRNTYVIILNTVQSVIQNTVPDLFSEYIIYGLKVATTYAESMSTAQGPNDWNQIVLNEMKTVQDFLPPNTTAQAFISVLINITDFFLASDQGNMSLWSNFENATVENISLILNQMDKSLSLLWQLVVGIPGSPSMTLPSLESFANLAPVLEQVMTGTADRDTWDILEKMLETLLSTFEGTELWDNASSVIYQFESIVGAMVNIEQAENAMVLSLQLPIMTLMKEIVQSVNTSHFNLSDISERIQLAVESMANSSLDCGEVLKVWEPVREAAGLSNDAMALWCNISLEPVSEAYTEAQIVFSHLNTSHMGVGPMTVSDAAARIVSSVQCLYQVNVNRTLVTEQLIWAFSNHLSMLASEPLSPEAQLYWNNQLQDMQWQNSLFSNKFLSDELVSVAPFLSPYIKAMENTLQYILNNYDLVQNSSLSQDFFGGAAMSFLTSMNTTSDNIFSMVWGNVSGLNESTFTDMMREAVKLLSDGQIFKEAPVVYQALEQLLASKDTNLIVPKITEITAWLASQQNITSDNIFSMSWGNISGFNEMAFNNIMREVVKLLTDHQVFGDDHVIYQVLEQYLASNDTSFLVQNMTEMSAWLASTDASGLDLLTQALPKIFNILRPFFSVLTQMNMNMLEAVDVFEELAGNIIAMLRELGGSSDLFPPVVQPLGMFQQEMLGSNYTMVRQRREAPLMAIRDPMDDFIDLFYINYPAMFEAISVPPTTKEIMETVHMFFDNPDLSVVLKGASSGIPWALNVSREETIDAALGVLSSLTLTSAFQMPPMGLLTNSVDMLPDDFPFSSVLKNITRAMVNESQDNLNRMQQIIQTVTELFQINLTHPQLTGQLDQLRSQVCALENTESVRLLMLSVFMEPGQLCNTYLPIVQSLVESLFMNITSLTDALFQAVIGDPSTYTVERPWTSVLSQHLDFNISSLSEALNMNITSPGLVTLGELLWNETAFVLEVQQRMSFDPAVLNLLMETPLPNNNLEILSWLANLRQCDQATFVDNEISDAVILKTFCSMSGEQWYTFSMLMARHVNMEKVIFRVVLSEEMELMLQAMLYTAKAITDMMDWILPAVGQLQNFMINIQELNLVANNEFKQMTRGKRSISTQATFVTLSRALCSNGIKALFGITKLPMSSESDPSLYNVKQREDLIDRFKIPQNATPFCTNMYLDMVSTTGGAIAWAFLKPMLMGQILFTPDTPVTRAIMEKANATLQEFADLRKNSEEWIETSNYIVESSKILGNTLPMLQNSLSNSFVKNFIEMQTDIDVDKMKETLGNFSNLTAMLEKNKHILNQITTLSTLMVDLSSCIKFDRYRGFDSADELNTVAQELAKNRDLYASVIFKSLSTSSTSSLPPKVSYTIRMHMDNVMRTDRVRDSYFVKDTHILARQTMRYNRGFIYLQETIDRAIIEAQIGQKVTEPAVQLQPFPYPCFQRDEFLQAISYVFPVMLMIAWVLFISDFVRKLVHERELRLHEYMKMMGVNPLSHFFAWFLECAAYLLSTIFVLTLLLKYGKILPNSDGFLLFLYLCDYGFSVLAFSYLVSSFFDKTYIAGLSGSLIYVLCFFPFIMVLALETNLTFSQKSVLSLFAPTCFSYASQYVSRYETQGEGIQWSNSYSSPIAGDTASFGWLCWLMLIDSILYFIIGAYIRTVFPGKYGIPAPWYFPFKASFWADLCCCNKSKRGVEKGLLFSNIMQNNQPVFSDGKGKGMGKNDIAGENFSELPVGVSLLGLSKLYGNRAGIENLNVSFYEGHVTSLLGHNGAGKTTTMSLLTGLFPPSSGTIEVYGRDMQTNIEDVRKDLGVCMQYDVLFDHLTTKEHLLLYGQIKAPHWSPAELREQVRTILEETGMHAHRHKLVGTLSGGMKRKLSISIAFIGGSRLVVLDEPTTGVDPCSRRSIWDIVIQHKKNRTIIMSTHHLDEAEVLSDRIAFLERGGLKCCGSPFYLKDKLGQGYKLTLTKKMQTEHEQIDSSELKAFVQSHVPEARLKESQGGDLIYSLPPFTSSNASSYRSLLTALDSNLDTLQLSGYGISDTTLEEVFLQLTRENAEAEGGALSISQTVSDTGSIDSFSSDLHFSPLMRLELTGSTKVRGMALAWQQMTAILIKRFHHSRRDWKGLISQILLPVFFVVFAMGLGSLKNDLHNYPEMELSPALYNIGPSYSFFRNLNPNSSKLVDTMTSIPGIDNSCLDNSDNPVCKRSSDYWSSSGNSSKPFKICRCTRQEQVMCLCVGDVPIPHKQIPSSQIVYNISGINVETYLIATANDFIRNRYGGFDFGMPLPSDLQLDLRGVPKNRTLSKVWFNPEGYHTMPAYLNSLNNLILRSNLPTDKDPRKYAISVSSHPYFGRADDDDIVIQGLLQILVAMCVLTGFSITTSSFAIYEVKEHHSGSKRLQHIAGISEPFYWAVNFFYDMVIYMIPVTLTVGVIAAFQIQAFTSRQNLAAIALLLVLFGFATFPWMYLLSGTFKDAEMAFITYVCINLFVSVNTILSTSILYFLSQLSGIFDKLSQAFLIFPQFNFGNGLNYLARVNIEVQILSGYGIDAYKNPFSMDALGWMFLSSFIEGLVLFTLRLLLNKSFMRKIRRKAVPQVPNEYEDEDVATERLRISSGAASSDILQVNKLTKVYQHLKKKVHAVRSISVGIPAGECFGLLGVNGAGKTTTFKMLTGDVSPTDGTAQIKDLEGRLVDIMECRDKGINIGYCPQVDALDDLLTGEEHMYFYARIRGISKSEIKGVVNYLLKRLELNYHRKIITDSYSCGTRRKLSTALALIGHPQILLLDEPSSGMDPCTKRHLWKIISEEVKGKCAVILTSHSMEECEALCSRLAIMVKGQFQCLGSLQHIKNRFGSGFTVKMYLAKGSCDAEAITGFMQRRFPSTYLKDQHSNMVEYHIPIAPGGVADIFDQLESNKNALQIKHFSVSQTTLDEVFINFAMENTGMETIPIHSEDELDNLGSVKAVET
uniref:ABC transporter domain-containing protein n=1 Tax=Anabas testudineus TaxID=64144 RepID=A0A7N6BK81_ANATE